MSPSAASPTTTPTAPQTFAPAVSAPRRSGAQRCAIWLGGAVVLFGALLAVAGGGILAAFGTDGVAMTGRHALATPTSALVSGTAAVDSGGFVDNLGSARIRFSAHADGGRPVFVGVARAQDVDRYLAGAATDEVRSFDASPFRSTFSVALRRHAGHVTPGAPGRQPFWVSRSTGNAAAAVDWKVRDGRYRVVIMNADGSRGVATQSRFGVSVPYAPGVGLGVLIGGLVLIAAGIASIVLGARRPRG